MLATIPTFLAGRWHDSPLKGLTLLFGNTVDSVAAPNLRL